MIPQTVQDLLCWQLHTPITNRY